MRIIPFLLSMLSAAAILAVAPAVLMRVATAPYLYSDPAEVPHASAALVLGASVVRGVPSPILAERTRAATGLYKSRTVGQVLVTGAVEKNYDEVTPMQQYLLSEGVKAPDIALDKAGVDTFSSMYRARNVFLADSLVILTQDFHLPRALFIARAMHIRAYGLAVSQAGTWYDYLREIPASWKALWDVAIHRTVPDTDTVAPLMIAGATAG